MSACHFCGTTIDPKMRIVRDTLAPAANKTCTLASSVGITTATPTISVGNPRRSG